MLCNVVTCQKVRNSHKMWESLKSYISKVRSFFLVCKIKPISERQTLFYLIKRKLLRKLHSWMIPGCQKFSFFGIFSLSTLQNVKNAPYWSKYLDYITLSLLGVDSHDWDFKIF